MASCRVGFIGGGQMAQALIGGAIKAGVLNVDELTVAEPAAAQRDLLASLFPGLTIVTTANEVMASCERIVLAVKPHILRSIAPDLEQLGSARHQYISIAAGVSIRELKELLSSERVIRVMPNTPALVGAGAAAVAADSTAAAEDIAWVQALMNSVGTSVLSTDELMHAVTAVSGSSPAYFYMVIEAMSDGGVAMGLPRSVATQLSAQAMLGAARMVLETGLHPGVLKDQVTSPGGTTLAALRELEGAGVRSAFIEAIAACVDRSQELSE